MAAKRNEIKNLTDYDMFEQVQYEGQDMIGSQRGNNPKREARWAETSMQSSANSKRIPGVSELQSNSPTALKGSFKLLMAIAANLGFKLAFVDIRVVFLQSKDLDRDVFVKPPGDIKKPGWIWKLKKSLYGLDEASKKFWLEMKKVFLSELGLQTLF